MVTKAFGQTIDQPSVVANGCSWIDLPNKRHTPNQMGQYCFLGMQAIVRLWKK